MITKSMMGHEVGNTRAAGSVAWIIGFTWIIFVTSSCDKDGGIPAQTPDRESSAGYSIVAVHCQILECERDATRPDDATGPGTVTVNILDSDEPRLPTGSIIRMKATDVSEKLAGSKLDLAIAIDDSREGDFQLICTSVDLAAIFTLGMRSEQTE